MPKSKARRDYGSGSLKLRGSVYYYRFYDRNGNRCEGSTGETVEKKAQVALAKKIAEANGSDQRFAQRAVSGVTKFTVEDLLNQYAAKRKEKKGESALGMDEYIIEKSLKPFFGHIEVRKLETQDTVLYRKHRRSEVCRNGDNAKAGTARGRKHKPSHSTIDRELRILKAAIRSLWKEGNPLMRYPINVHLENEDNKRVGFISPQEFITKLLPCFPRRLKWRVALLFCAGPRFSETKAIDISHVDLANGILYIPKSKNGDGREIPVFRGLMRQAIEEQLAYCAGASPDCPALFTYNGKRAGVSRKTWERIVAKAGYPDLKPHDLRRSAAKNMRNAGIPGSIIMKIMGHKSQAMLLRYDIIDANDIRVARNLMDIKAEEWTDFKVAA